jgi:zinc transporter, ZIP family
VDDQLQLILMTLPIAVVLGCAGGIGALFWEPSDQWRSIFQNIAAGLLTGIIAVDILPEVRQEGDPLFVIAGFAVGAILMVSLNKFADRLETQRDRNRPIGLALAAAIDTGVDGLIIGAGFAASDDLGVLLVIALGLELCVLTFSVGAEYRDSGAERWMTTLVTTGIAAMVAVGALSGYMLFGNMEPATIAIILAFAAAALLYLVAGELLVKAHMAAQSTRSIASFFLGFLALMAFTLLIEES